MSVRRILVAVDASRGSVLAAEAAARLAARLEAELEGIFVEDVRLLRLAQSPLAREVDSITAGHRQPGSDQLQRQLRIQGVRAREELRRIAQRKGIKWSFRIARGAVSSEIAAAAAAAEIVSLGHEGWSTRPQRALGAAASAILERTSSCVLLMRRSLDVKTPVLALFDGSEQAERALRLARQLALGEIHDLEILLLGTDPAALRSQVGEILGAAAGASIVGAVATHTAPDLARTLVKAGAGALVVPVGGDSEYRHVLHDILERMHCPVLLVS